MLLAHRILPGRDERCCETDAVQAAGCGSPGAGSGCTASSASMNSKPVPDPDRQDFQNAQGFGQNPDRDRQQRKHTNAPVIQKTTRTRGATVTSGQSGRGQARPRRCATGSVQGASGATRRPADFPAAPGRTPQAWRRRHRPRRSSDSGRAAPSSGARCRPAAPGRCPPE